MQKACWREWLKGLAGLRLGQAAARIELLQQTAAAVETVHRQVGRPLRRRDAEHTDVSMPP